ncbi:MAG: aminotransferase class I/II-fold pyridoxal phosphate-dependent enzyme, partial [Patescibacteria group bacterium]
GEEVLIIAPYWVSYTGIVKIYGGIPVILSTAEMDGWKIKPEQLAAACNQKTKLLILNNAANPTGALYRREELTAILKVAKEKNLIVISDEVYSGLVYDNEEFVSAGSFFEHKDKVIVVQSCSKIFAMTGWRVGFVFGPEPAVKIIKTLQGQSTTGTSTMGQWAAVAGFKEADRIVWEIREEMQKRRNVFVETFNNLFPRKITAPASGLYCFIPIAAFGSAETDSVAFSARVLAEANVAMVPGAAFGKEGYARCSFGCEPEELREALGVLAEYLKRDGGH